jgi:hypothetical protein
MPRRLRLSLAAALVISAVLACENSPFEPKGEGERVPIGQEITDEVGSNSTAHYSFVGEPGAAYAIFLEALSGTASLIVHDSTHLGFAVANVFAGPGSPPLYQNATQTMATNSGAVYNFLVAAVSPATSTHYRFLVYRINQDPELREARFNLGDTVSGETIDPIVDQDEFIMHGDAGQEFVAVAETQGPPGSGSVALNVVDPVQYGLFGYVFADAGTTTLTTGRLRLPAAQDYRFYFGSVLSNVYPRYSGPYRFWTYLINRAPEHRSATGLVNTEVANEKIDIAGDVDEFAFSAGANTDFNAFLQSTHGFQLEVAPVGQDLFALVPGTEAPDTALFAHPTGSFHIATAGTYVVRISGTQASRIADTGSYRWYLYPIDHRPEHVAAAMVPGDTISGEDIALPGDVDEFTFSGAVGQEFNVFFQARGGSMDTRLQLEVLNDAGAVVATAQSAGNDTDLMGQVTGRFTLTRTATYRMRVSGIETRTNTDRGPYRLSLYPIDRRPEHVPRELTLGDSVSGEALDASGDVDEFKVTVPATTGANLVVEYDGTTSPHGWVTAQLIDSASGQPLAGISNATPGVRLPTGRVTLHPGTYIVRVEGYQTQSRSTERGPYRVWLYSFRLGPEAVADTFAVGETVIGESIAPWGDADVFHFHGYRGQHLNLKFQGLGASSSAEFVASLTPPGPPDAYPNAAVYSPTAATALDDHQTTRLELPVTGWYNLSVSGVGGIEAQGPYRFVIETEDSLPEQVSAALVPGDSVMTESIDRPGDWDQYTVSATAGQELGLVFDGRYAYSGDFAYIRAIDPNAGDTLTGTVGQFKKFTGPFRVPAGGRVNVAIFEPGGFYRTCGDATCGGVYGLTGPYGLHIVPVNRAPEVASPAYVVGDTISNEAIDYIGDIDEFTVSGTPDDTLHAFFRMLAAPSLSETSYGLTVEMFDPAAGDPPVGSNAAYSGTSQLYPVGSFVVPPGGSFVIRFRGTGFWGEDITTGPYQFLITR